jgi:hypothetical protein
MKVIVAGSRSSFCVFNSDSYLDASHQYFARFPLDENRTRKMYRLVVRVLRLDFNDERFDVWLKHHLLGVIWISQVLLQIKDERVSVYGPVSGLGEALVYIYLHRKSVKALPGRIRFYNILFDDYQYPNIPLPSVASSEVWCIGCHPETDLELPREIKTAVANGVFVISNDWGRNFGGNREACVINLGSSLMVSFTQNMSVLKYLFISVKHRFDKGSDLGVILSRLGKVVFLGDMGCPFLMGCARSFVDVEYIGHSRETMRLGSQLKLTYSHSLSNFEKVTSDLRTFRVRVMNLINRTLKRGRGRRADTLLVLGSFYVFGVPTVSQKMLDELREQLDQCGALEVDVRSKRAKQHLGFVEQFIETNYPHISWWVEFRREPLDQLLSKYRKIIVFGNTGSLNDLVEVSGHMVLIPCEVKRWMN